jgi:2-keto-3-deoxy-L-rhamnonate aldolase RhmA
MHLKQLTMSRDIKLGHYVGEFATPGMGHILKAAGCDFVFFDLEHSGYSFETLKNAVRYFEAAGVALIARVASLQSDMLARACDVGAEGLIAPMISTREQAQALVDGVKYPPLGKRGVGLALAHDNFRYGQVNEGLINANERTTIFALIETAEGAANADAIAGVEGIDGLWLGHLDLSVSLGIPGQYDHPKFLEALASVVAAGQKHKKSMGRMVSTPELGVAGYKQGFDFCCYSGDVWLLRDALAAGVKAIRAGATK